MKTDIKKLKDCIFLFSGLSDETIAEAAADINVEKKDFEKNSCIYSPFDYEQKVGFVLTGECEVRRVYSDGGYTPLNLIGKYGSFGIIAIFSSADEYPTHIYAKRKTSVLFLEKSDVIKLARTYPDIAMNIITFMTERITFLNNKLATFTSTTVEQKLANYLYLTSKRLCSIEFPFNRKRSAEILNTGRASLYRALDSLTARGVINYDNKKIYIIDQQGLERISK